MADQTRKAEEAERVSTPEKGRGLKFSRFFTHPSIHPYDAIEGGWGYRTAVIYDEKGNEIFKQEDIEVPNSWSELALNVVVSKYFKKSKNPEEREKSVRQMIGRVAKTISDWSREDGYFASPEDADSFEAELTHILVNQMAAFNSPVWFNVGIEPRPQCSACFINSVEDSMGSILKLAHTEGMLFKYGSGTGTNLSTIRSSKELLSNGGEASGPVSFMRGYDAFAGVIKSGGKTRRAAKMVILDISHPDIEEFIHCKADEERKAWALIDAGYDGSFNGEAYNSIFFQNSNDSVRVTDEFMRAVLEDGAWQTRAVTDPDRVVDTHRARDLMDQVAEAAWVCGDPGLQFDTTVNDWHTCPETDRIYASNPCSEYMFLDDSACNLASLNLMKFRDAKGHFDLDAYLQAVRVMITAQEVIVDRASYPTPAIEQNSHDYRPLGLGYANLGALLMSRGIPYDSPSGRAWAGALAAIMTGEAYRMSAEIAGHKGPFAGYPKNAKAMLRVMRKHQAAVEDTEHDYLPPEISAAARRVWSEAVTLGEVNGYRNAQATVIAPTGTIAFLMDCDTTGIEPDIALVKYKRLVGGGLFKIVNRTVPEALRKLGYSEDRVNRIVAYIDENGTIEGAPGLKEEHLPVFDCAFKPAKGARSIHYMGHVRMMGAVQPFISGAISKTVNMPNDATAEDIARTYIDSWKLGLKAIAVYRDGCKRTQPLATRREDAGEAKKTAAEPRKEERGPVRRRLPDERKALIHKFSVGGHEGYIAVGVYDDETPGEIFITMAKEGSVISGLMDTIATATSIALQYGVPLRVLVDKFSHTRFEPAGYTNNPEIRYAKSLMDYIFRWLGQKFLKEEGSPSGGLKVEESEKEISPAVEGEAGGAAPSLADLTKSQAATLEEAEKAIYQAQADAPPCYACGSTMVRSGSCYRCLNCGETSGCG
ncbi:MAG: vitamin B12-dependent ribonucleotide reductase [Nitrospinota bacterium]